MSLESNRQTRLSACETRGSSEPRDERVLRGRVNNGAAATTNHRVMTETASVADILAGLVTNRRRTWPARVSFAGCRSRAGLVPGGACSCLASFTFDLVRPYLVVGGCTPGA